MNSNFIFSPVGEDPVAAVKSGALMAIGADHGRYASGLSGSAKTINPAQAVFRCANDLYAILPLDHHHIYISSDAGRLSFAFFSTEMIGAYH